MKRIYPDRDVAEKAEAPAGAEEDENKVFDKISSVIIEEIGEDKLLLRGRKNN